MENKPGIKNEEILNAIIPPREWIQGGKHWMQKASPQPASRIDVARLREMLDQKLMERQARESGICPVREELFKQCFEEIIRQVTLNMHHRGLLLLRVKRDIYSNIQAYQTLYNSSVTFAMRKQLQAEHGKAELVKKRGELEKRKKKQAKKIVEQKAKIESIKAIIDKKREDDKKKNDEEIKFLQQQSEHLKRFLKQVEQAQKDANK